MGGGAGRAYDPLVPAPDEIPGHELLEVLSEGPGATVHRARERGSGRLVALKVLRPLGGGPEAERARQRRFLEEGGRLLELDCPHVVRALDVGTSPAGAWLALELLEGPTLQALLERGRGPLPLDATLAAGVQLARALAALAAADLTHRDLGPGHVLVDAEGQARLVGFGAGVDPEVGERLGRGALPLGAVDYLSPEQVEGDVAPSPRSDVYALGATLYRCLAGRTPHSGTTLFARLRSIVQAAPPDVRELNPEVPDAVAQALALLMERDGDDRPLARDVEDLLQRVAWGLGLRDPGWERAALARLVAARPEPGGRPAARRGEPPLTLRLRGTERTFELRLAPGEHAEVGRSSEAQVSLPFGWISRRHARLERRPDGVWVIDLESANGTTLNRARLEAPARLAPGDLVAFGKSRFEVGLVEATGEGALRCALCGADLDLDGTSPGGEGGRACARCRERAEVDRAALDARLERTLRREGLEPVTRLVGRGPLRRFLVRGRDRTFLAGAAEVGHRTAEQLAAESAAATTLDHPGIWPVVRVDARDGVLLTLGPAPDGATLEAVVQEHGPLAAGQAARLGRRLADALDHAARAGVRAALVRPDLVLVTPEGGHLLDVGLAPALLEAGRSRVGVAAREPCYEAPELTDVGGLGPRQLVYALGATLGFALTGSPVAELHAGERVEHLPLTMVTGIPRSIAYLLACATSPDPKERPASPGALRGAFDALIEELDERGRRPTDFGALDDDELTRPIELDDLPPEILFE